MYIHNYSFMYIFLIIYFSGSTAVSASWSPKYKNTPSPVTSTPQKKTGVNTVEESSNNNLNNNNIERIKNNSVKISEKNEKFDKYDKFEKFEKFDKIDKLERMEKMERNLIHSPSSSATTAVSSNITGNRKQRRDNAFRSESGNNVEMSNNNDIENNNNINYNNNNIQIDKENKEELNILSNKKEKNKIQINTTSQMSLQKDKEKEKDKIGKIISSSVRDSVILAFILNFR